MREGSLVVRQAFANSCDSFRVLVSITSDWDDHSSATAIAKAREGSANVSWYRVLITRLSRVTA